MSERRDEMNELILDILEELAGAFSRVCAKHGRSVPTAVERVACVTANADSEKPVAVVQVEAHASRLLNEHEVTNLEELAGGRAVFTKAEDKAAAPPLALEVVDGRPKPITVDDLSDPSLERSRMVEYLVGRGFDRGDASGRTREYLLGKCRTELEAEAKAGEGVKKRRGRPPKAPAAPAAPVAAQATAAGGVADEVDAEFAEVLAALPEKALNRIAEATGVELTDDVMEFAVGVRNVVVDRVGLDGMIEAVMEAGEDDADTRKAPPVDDPNDGEVVTVVTPPSPVVKQEPDVAAAAVSAGISGREILAIATDAFGFEGVLYDHITSGTIAENIEGIEGSFGELVKGEPRFKDYFQRMGCKGACTACPRGGGQVAVCATMIDADVPRQAEIYVALLDGTAEVKLRNTGRDPFDASQPEPTIAAVDSIR